MRIFRGLENIHSVIDKHQAEWLREQGEEPERPERISVEERIRRSFAEGSGLGRFSADRFMGGHAHVKAEPEPQIEPQIEAPVEREPQIEVVNVLPQNEENHSWLYNEVLKAIRDAVGDSKNTKVVAVFVPVVQNVKEFESLPVDETITIEQPAQEEANEDLIAHEQEEHEEQEAFPEPVEPEIPEIEAELPEIESEPEPELPEIEPEPELEIPEPELTETETLPEAQEPEPEPELPALGDEFDLLPEGQDEPDAELADAFQTIEDNLDDSLQKEEPEHEPEPEQEEQEETFNEPEELPVIEEADEPAEAEPDDVMAISEGEPLAFSEIEEIELPEPLDDDEIVFDDSVFEEPLAMSEAHDETDEDSDKETITIEYKDEELPDENKKEE